MPPPLVPHRIVVALIVTALLLPITICVVWGVSSLLVAMGDLAGGGVLQRIALGFGILWVIGLISLLLILAIATLRGPEPPDRPE
jgi:hypothetical protein